MDLNFELTQILLDAHFMLGKLEALLETHQETKLFHFNYLRKEAVLAVQLAGAQVSLEDLLLYELQIEPKKKPKAVRKASNYVRSLATTLTKLKQNRTLSQELFLGLFEAWNESPTSCSHQASLQQQLSLSLETLFHSKHHPFIKAALAYSEVLQGLGNLPAQAPLASLCCSLFFFINGLVKEPVLFLSLYFRSFRREYERVLKKGAKDSTPEDWILFFAKSVCKITYELIENIQQLASIFNQDKDLIQTLGKLEPSAHLVLEAFAYRPIANTTYLHSKTGITHATINRVLVELERLDIIKEMTGQKRARIFCYSRHMELLS